VDGSNPFTESPFVPIDLAEKDKKKEQALPALLASNPAGTKLLEK
jgi:hypothetical protein